MKSLASNFLLSNVTPEKYTIPLIRSTYDPILERKMFDIIVPYIDGISFNTLNKILNEEKDFITSFRLSIKKAISESKDQNNDINQIHNDIIRPEIDKLNFRFKSLMKITSVKMTGAILSTVTVSLLTLTNTGVIQAVTSLFGAGGLALITKEYAEHLKSKDQLSENPYYLLWKLNKK